MKVAEFGPDSSVPYQKMYTTLFNAFTTALELMEGGNVWQAKAVLMEAQKKTEEMYIEGEQ